MGAATWYARGINREYKAVQQSETELLAAARDFPFTPPADLTPTADRLDAFLVVRDSLAGRRLTLEAAASDFADARERNRGRGVKGFWGLLGSGTDLAPVYASYWQARNHALLAVRMSPAEYIWLYSLVYYEWLGRDPGEGRAAHQSGAPVRTHIEGDLPAAATTLLAARRLSLEAAYSPALNPVELIFASDRVR
jgi:hypothetical protein